MPINLLDKVRTALKRPTPTTEHLATAVDDARRAEADALAAVDRAQAVVKVGFMDEAAKRQADRNALATAREAAEDAALVRAEAERRHLGAVEGEEQARRRGLYDSARAEAEAAAADLAKQYPKLSGDLVALLGRLARAQQAVALVNGQLPDGVVPIADPEMVARGAAGASREVVSDTEVEAWSRLDSDKPLDEPFRSQIYAVGTEGWGKRSAYVGGKSSLGEAEALYRLRRFRRVEFREAVLGNLPTPLAASIHLPSLRGTGALWGDAWGHQPNSSLIGQVGGADHEAVLAQLARIDAEAVALPTKTDRPLKIEWTLLGDVVPLAWERPMDSVKSKASKSGSRFGASPFAPAGTRAGSRR